MALGYGAYLVEEGSYSLDDVQRTLLVLMNGGISVSSTISMAMPNYGRAIEAARRIFEVLDLRSAIDPLSSKGAKYEPVMGSVRFREVRFAYPLRQDAIVFDGLSLELPAGQMSAIIGPSGSGKSTVVSLILRFYDPLGGEVLLDGVDLRTLNVRWLREQIGVVMQEPTLFQGTIKENIGYGRQGSSEAEIESAARVANAHNFISELPEGYETDVGSGGAQLSGGQRQRVAIARALLREPKVLIFDEATSALDNQNERELQTAIDHLLSGASFTSVVIAHRLSTVRHADKIIVIDGGRLVEEGTHDQLLAFQGYYAEQLSA